MNAIEIKGLEKRFRDFALCGIDLSLPEGCILGLIGENGAGKTTLIKTMLDLYHRDAGSVQILGRSVPEDLTEIRRGISVLLDDVGLPPQFTAADTDSVMRDTFGDWDSACFFSVLERFGV
ncbi:MAG: ATP-binding cassette domain-containing protein, partial [Lachnospiraceae bacterium]|nr:ATP-binding cassette domain-containing protein [Lachnospiraceae bacterium]